MSSVLLRTVLILMAGLVFAGCMRGSGDAQDSAKDASLATEASGRSGAGRRDDYNQDLSTRYAAAVVDWLVENGIGRARLAS